MPWHRRIADIAGKLAGANPVRAGDLLCVFLLIVLCLGAGLPRYSSGLDFGDEGLLAYGGLRVMNGQVPNRDFVTLQPPLSFYIVAAVFKLLGTSVASLRILGLVIYLLVPLLSYGIARTLAGPLVALSAALPSAVLGISFTQFVPAAAWQGTTVCLAAALVYLRATQDFGRGSSLAFPAGILTAVATLLRQDQGVYLAVSLLVYTAVLKLARAESGQPVSVKAPLVLWAAGLIAVVLPLGVYWIAVGAFGPMWRQLVVFPLSTYSKTSSLPFPAIRSGFEFGPNASVLLYYVPLVAVPFGLLALGRRFVRRNFGPREARFCLLLVWSALFYCQVLVRTDMDHLLIALPSFFILVATGFGEALRGMDAVLAVRTVTRRVVRGLLVGLAAAFALVFLLLVRPMFLPPPLPASETIRLERAGVRKLGAANLKKFIERVQAYAPPEQSILCLPYQPMFYFLCERRNPTQWNYLWPGDQTPEDHEALIQQARNDPPSVVIITTEAEMQRYAAPILDYVHSEYRPAFAAGGTFLVYVRK
jgi:hypothetical protein